VRPPEGRRVGLAAQILIGLVAACEVVALVLCVRLLASEAKAIDAFFTILAIGSFEGLVMFPAGAVFISWLAKMHRNIQFLRGPTMHWSTGWIVGGFFLPFANVIIPYLAIQEMWIALAPKRFDDVELEPRPPTSSGLIIAWWIVWVAALCLYFTCRQFIRPLAFEPNTTAILGLIVAHGLLVLDAPLAILVIRAMTRRQEERWKSIVEEETGADA
jgi:hypothetical protein